MGGKSSPSNSQMVQFQMQQAQEAREKEAQRKARLESGKKTIDDLFSDESFGKDFYDKFQNAELNFNLPQVWDQYDRARKNMTFDLARAGTLRSSIAGEAQADVENQKAVNEASVRAKADTDVANLKSSIGSQQQQAYNQLYATEDPDIAATTAINMVHNAQLTQPNLNPLGELFKPLIIGATGLASGYQAQTDVNKGLSSKSPFADASKVYG